MSVKEVKKRSFSIMDSPWGCLEIEYSEKGIYALRKKEQKFRQKESKNQKEPCFVSECRRQLKSYFKEAKTNLFSELDMDYSDYTVFQRRVLSELRKVRAGVTISYEELALKSGAPKGARAIGHVMSLNRTPIILPCHRVVRKNGEMGGFAYGIEWKKKLLKHEGIVISNEI